MQTSPSIWNRNSGRITNLFRNDIVFFSVLLIIGSVFVIGVIPSYAQEQNTSSQYTSTPSSPSPQQESDTDAGDFTDVSPQVGMIAAIVVVAAAVGGFVYLKKRNVKR